MPAMDELKITVVLQALVHGNGPKLPDKSQTFPTIIAHPGDWLLAQQTKRSFSGRPLENEVDTER